MKLTTLIDNRQNVNQLKCEHGLSFYLETDGLNIIFDTGQSNKFISNAQKLDIDLSNVDYVVLSHGHYDHTGGLPDFFELNSKAKAIISRKAFRQRFSRSTAMIKQNGIPWREELQKYAHRLVLIDDDFKLSDDIILLSNIHQQKEFEVINERLVVKEGGNLVADKFEDELVLVAQLASKPLVLCGCAHNGIINILQTIKERTGHKAFALVAGGLHLNGYASKEVNQILIGLKPFETDHWILNHCTGDNAFELFKQHFTNKVEYGGCGFTITL